jgi:Fe-S cluster biogenesis protein NfuA
MLTVQIINSGDVELVSCDARSVTLQLVGACGTCSSSETTMKNGIEKRLKARIPTIEEIVQRSPVALDVNTTNVESFLDTYIRPYLSVAGAGVEVVTISGGLGSMYPTVELKLASLEMMVDSVKDEIVQKLQSQFHSSVKVKWV